jgi:hypothetical protein
METKISYTITVCDEYVEIQKLITHLLKHKRQQDEIVVLFDKSKNSKSVEEYLRTHCVDGSFSWYEGEFAGNFAEWKNKLNSLCSQDSTHIFNIDADEIPNEFLIQNIYTILQDNPQVELLWVSRINTLEGDEKNVIEYVQSQGWRLSEQKYINYPDCQGRIYHNKSNIKWGGAVHETLTGIASHAYLPFEERFCLYHPKTLEKQIKQNNLYNNI